MKRVRFTRVELALINEMCAIASAACWGEGDYESWDDATGLVYDSLRDKVWELLNRQKGNREGVKHGSR